MESKSGVSFRGDAKGVVVVVSKVPPNSLFPATESELGHVVLTVNGIAAQGKKRHWHGSAGKSLTFAADFTLI